MNNAEIIKELEKVENKYKDKVFATGELNIHELVKSCKYKIQELNQENNQLREQLEKERKVRNEAIEWIESNNNSWIYYDKKGNRIYKNEDYWDELCKPSELLKILDIGVITNERNNKKNK